MRQKRLTFWPKKEQEELGSQEASEEQKKGDKSEEGSDEYNDYDDVSSDSKNKDYDNVSGNPDSKDYHDEGSYGKGKGYGDVSSQNGNKDYGEEDESTFYDEFSTNPEFSDFDVDFENFGGSKESGDFYDHKSLQRRRDEQLDGYIREYVAQLNKDPVKASGPMDLSYYEKIAEATVEKGRIPSLTPCHGKVRYYYL